MLVIIHFCSASHTVWIMIRLQKTFIIMCYTNTCATDVLPNIFGVEHYKV